MLGAVEAGHAGPVHEPTGIFKSGRSAYFARRKIDQMTNKYRLERCCDRIGRGKFVGSKVMLALFSILADIVHCRIVVGETEIPRECASEHALFFCASEELLSWSAEEGGH